jgi:hypothetical protein
MTTLSLSKSSDKKLSAYIKSLLLQSPKESKEKDRAISDPALNSSCQEFMLYPMLPLCRNISLVHSLIMATNYGKYYDTRQNQQCMCQPGILTLGYLGI